jgi:hypothetical protein
VRDRHAAGEQLEHGFLDPWQIPDGAIGYACDAAQGGRDMRMNLAE